MATLPQTAERKKRRDLVLGSPDTLDVICAHVASGGTLIDLAETWDLPFGWVSNWVHSDKERGKRYMQALNDRAEWGAERILKELRTIGLADIRKAFNEDGSMKPPHTWPDDLARAVSAVETDELFEGAGRDRTQIGLTRKLRFNDKIRALELLGKNLALFVERHEHSGTVTLADLVTASQEDDKK